MVSHWTGIPFCVSIHTDYEKYYQMTGRKKGNLFLFKILEKFVLPRAPLLRDQEPSVGGFSR
jgi:hypothetical protein